MNSQRTMLTGALAAACLLATAACTGGSGSTSGGSGGTNDTVTFQTWSLKNDTFTPYFEGVIKAFEADNPGVTVKWVDQPAQGYEDKVLQQAESGELPDVVNLPPEYAYVLADAGQLADLSTAAPVADYVDGGVEAYTFDGVDGVYGLPWYLGTELNFWNTDLLSQGGLEIPGTMAELFDAADTLAGLGIQSISDIPGPKTLTVAVSDAGGHLDIYKDGEFVFDTPEAIAVVERYAALYQAGALTPEALQGAGEANANINNFNKGTVAFTTAGPNYPEKDLSVNAPNVLATTAVTSGFGNPPLFVQGISVSKKGGDNPNAVKFAEYVTNTENQVEFIKLAPGFFPGTKAGNADPSAFAKTSEIELQNQATDLASAQMDDTRLLNPPQYSEAMETYAKQQIALAVRGDITAAEAMQRAIEYCEQNVAD